jgi:hypothetical protein
MSKSQKIKEINSLIVNADSPAMILTADLEPDGTVKVYGKFIPGGFDRDITIIPAGLFPPGEDLPKGFDEAVERERKRLMDGGEIIEPDMAEMLRKIEKKKAQSKQ